jgi:hypothetical protein
MIFDKQKSFCKRVIQLHLHATLEHVGQGEIRNVDVIVVEFDAGTNSTGSIGHDVSVAEHGAFGVSCGTAGEADRGKHVGLGRADGSGTGFAFGLDFIEGYNGKIGIRLLGGFVDGSHYHDVLE